MDTKALYDLADAAKIGFQHEDGYHDARQVWIDGYMASPEWLTDIWIDALVDMKEDKMQTVLKQVGYVHEKVEQSQKWGTDSVGLTCSMASSLGTANSHLGMDIYGAILTFVESYVEQYAEEWWVDCCSYHSDMIEGQYEDYKYQEHKDRMLEERE